MVQIQVTIYSTSKLAEEDFVFRLVFLALPPPLRFRRERLLLTFCSSSSPLYIRSCDRRFVLLNFRFVVNPSSGPSIIGSFVVHHGFTFEPVLLLVHLYRFV